MLFVSILNKRLIKSMNYSRIEKLRKNRRVTLEELAEALHMTKNGYEKMIKQESCKVSTLESIAKYFEVPVIYFYEEESDNNEASNKSHNTPYSEIEHHNLIIDPKVTTYSCSDCIQKEKLIQVLNEVINSKQETIDSQKVAIETQRNLIATLQGDDAKNSAQNCG